MCLVSSLWFSCGVAVSMGEAAKPLLFEGFQASCHVVLRGRRGTLWHSNLFANVSKMSKLEEVSYEMCVFLHPGVSSRVSGFPVASPCLWGKLRTPHSTLYTSHSTIYALDSTLHTLHCTLHSTLLTWDTPHFTLYTPHSTLYIVHFTLYTPHSNFWAWCKHVANYAWLKPLPSQQHVNETEIYADRNLQCKWFKQPVVERTVLDSVVWWVQAWSPHVFVCCSLSASWLCTKPTL